MTTENRYTPPRAAVADIQDSSDTFQEIRIWSAKGRIGRLRYLAYSTGSVLLVGLIAGLAGTFRSPMLTGIVVLLAYIPVVIFGFLIMIQRSHDMNWSGWTVLFGFIPLVALIWIFKAGSTGENEYGAPPPPNTTGVKILGLMFPIIALVGILAAIALPAYQQYVQRAKAVQHAP